MKEERNTGENHNMEVAIRRLGVLQLAEKLGNVSEACRQSGMSRANFYIWKCRFQAYGLAGLKDLPPVHFTHPQTTTPEVEEKIIATCLKYVNRGCVELSKLLKQEGISISSPTIQKILIRHKLGQKQQRRLAIEKKHLTEGMPLTPEQTREIEKSNPCFRERHAEAQRPGELLVESTFCVGTLPGVGRIYLDAVVDTYSSFAFGFLHSDKVYEGAVPVLRQDIFPILQHRRIKIVRSQYNGFVERFKRTVLAEFFRIAFKEKKYITVDALQKDFDQWMYHYNYERTHLGYRNMGKRPIDMIRNYGSAGQGEARRREY